MRIIWNEVAGWFQLELQIPEVPIAKQAGFKTFGPPQWVWKTQKASVLNKLRKLNPASGIDITELALQKYNLLNQQETEKKNLKKKFDKESKAARLPKQDEYFDAELGFICVKVEPALEPFTWSFIPPKPPETSCFNCGNPTYFLELPDLCIYCEGNS
jgi:hypothetical protein